ncbi:MAG: peptide deformylase [Alphaproteobacteria bacterium]
MAILDILLAPHPTLVAKAKPVEGLDDEICTLAADMLQTMYDAPGIGLAANQVGRLERVLVMDCQRDPEGEPMPKVLVNPEIIWESDELASYEEGCLSIPQQYADVERPAEVKVVFMDLNGHEQEAHFTGLEATCVQHEIDHLNGVLFWDHVSTLKRNMLKRKLSKLKKERERASKQGETL